jgi:glutamine amidotransferase
MLALDPALFGAVEGTTDSEVVFHLALTFGLEDDPIAALERAVGFIEALAAKRGIDDPVQASFGVTDGETLWGVRYNTGGRARTLYMSADVDTIRHLYPENERFSQLSPDDRLIVSEPFSDLPGLWEPVAEATAVTVRSAGAVEQRPFTPG